MIRNAQPARTVAIQRQPIELYKFLKLADMVQSGGEAKFVIGEGLVRVNGTTEKRKRKKIIAGDRIHLAGETVEVIALK